VFPALGGSSPSGADQQLAVRVSAVKHTGDGVLAMGIEVRAGVHTGEIEWRGDDVGGIAVRIGQRVSALAGPGEVLVSRTVTDLVAGSGLRFEERGEYELKGVSGSWETSRGSQLSLPSYPAFATRAPFCIVTIFDRFYVSDRCRLWERFDNRDHRVALVTLRASEGQEFPHL
jgi:Adenylate and Guanylate cyclase catalytic domain